MLNQLNINSDATYTDLYTIDSDIDIIVEQDMTDEDSPRINYLDLGADGVSTQIADQQEAPTHNGVVSFDSANYKIADTVVVTLIDQDLNKNTASDEDLSITNSTNTHLVPSLQIGSPLTVSAQTDVVKVNDFSKIAYYTNASSLTGIGNTANFTIYTGYTGADMDAIDTVNTYFNWDFSAF
jgi:hypothetical protein